MMEFDEYIDIDKEEIPYSFEIDLDGETFEIEVNYNQTFDFFTVELFKNDEPIVVGEKIVMNRPLFRNRIHNDLPSVLIIPMDRAFNERRITYENFNETVFLYIVQGSELK